MFRKRKKRDGPKKLKLKKGIILKKIKVSNSLLEILESAIKKKFCVIEYGNKRYNYVCDRFFVNNSTDEYYYLQENFFIKTKLFRGSGLNMKIMLNWKKENIKNV